MEPQSWLEQLVPPTLHATTILEEPVTVTVNCWVVATTTLCVLGSTTTVTDLLPPPKPRRFSMLLALQPVQEKQDRTRRIMASRRTHTPSQMPDEYAERWRNSVQRTRQWRSKCGGLNGCWQCGKRASE